MNQQWTRKGSATDQQWTGKDQQRPSNELANELASISKGPAMDQQCTSNNQHWTSNGLTRSSSRLPTISKDQQWTRKNWQGQQRASTDPTRSSEYQEGLARTSKDQQGTSNGPKMVQHALTSNEQTRIQEFAAVCIGFIAVPLQTHMPAHKNQFSMHEHS